MAAVHDYECGRCRMSIVACKCTDYPDEIGGRSTELTQLGYSFYGCVKESFAINEVPQDVVAEVREIQFLLEQAEQKLKRCIESIRKLPGQSEFLVR